MDRYVVTELEGWPITPRNRTTSGPAAALPGLSCNVIDTLVNPRLIATYRTEDVGRNGMKRESRRELIRAKAREHAGRLNAA